MQVETKESTAFQVVKFEKVNSNPLIKRIIIKEGAYNVAIKVSDIVYFINKERRAIAYMNDGTIYNTGKNLNHWQELLSKDLFFRANRDIIINGWYIIKYKTYQRKKIEAEIAVGVDSKCFLISERKASEFRNWVNAL
jgi:DNA-binding LytR/AlgR family response regulator